MNLLTKIKLSTLSKLITNNGAPPDISILIVEDDGIQRQAWSLALHGMTGLVVEVAGSVGEALDKVKDSDLLLLDWGLGRGTGDTVLENWLGHHAGNPCMVISGVIPPDMEERLLMSGVANIYRKPLGIGIVIRTVHRYMREMRAYKSVQILRVERVQMKRALLYSGAINLVTLATLAVKEGATLVNVLKALFF